MSRSKLFAALLLVVGNGCSARSKSDPSPIERDSGPTAPRGLVCNNDPEPCEGACNPAGYCEQDLGWGAEIRVPAATYVVSYRERKDRIGPHEFALATFPVSFWISTRETSIADYRRCEACEPLVSDAAQELPAVLSRAQAVAFCAATGRRLPTNSEWEAAGRGPTTCTDPEEVKVLDGVGTCNSRTFPWGDQDDRLCDWTHTSECVKQSGPRVIVSRPEGASPLGVEEMIGNVAEWIEETRTVPDVITSVPVEEGIVKGWNWRLLGDLDDRLAPELTLSRQMHVPVLSPHEVHRHGVRCVRGAPMQVEYQLKELPW